MDYPNPYLIQRLERKKTEGKLDAYRFGEVWDLYYMGSAEFEFGAFPRFLRQMGTALLGRCTVKVSKDLTVFAVYDMSQYADDAMVKAVITDIAKGKTRHKGGPDFPPRVSQYNTPTTAWVDVAHGLFWSVENMGLGFSKLVANSIAFMEAEKAKEKN